ncbi:hypothetical protein [Methanogenium sp. MK-MG]|uniref:hypothetical protein n=1 Tax=Methanogenium sp. MK-MG TaxID=2599926 RepID=UPI0013EAE91E|nr:hypothetical protein [Methanogenium sp. MK-MG]KAF1076645.1 hypothetical protein MKMG_01459 [Methanogenium sp. MK-MG]
MIQKNSISGIYIGLLGLVTLACGLADIFVWAGINAGFQVGILEIAGDDFFRWAWGGFIMVCAGLFMLAGSRKALSLQQFAKVTLGTVLVWLIAGTDIFARLCESIPAGEEAPEFFNSLSGFIGGFAPPYSPAIILLPFTLVILYLLYTQAYDTD